MTDTKITEPQFIAAFNAYKDGDDNILSHPFEWRLKRALEAVYPLIVSQERERCAKIADAVRRAYENSESSCGRSIMCAAGNIARAIRDPQ